MAIRVERNEQGNCVNFHGSSNPTYWNACLTAYVDDNVADAINVVNDIITAQTGVTEYEFYQIPYTEFTRADNSDFSTAQEAADYITAAARVIGVSPESSGNDLTDVTVCFKLDDTSTSIILDNGYSFGVNTIKAVAEGGNIEIHSISGNRTLFSNLQASNVCINDVPVSGGLNDVVNSLNELFTVGAFEQVVISDPYSTMVADVGGINTTGSILGTYGIDPIGDDIFSASSNGSRNGWLSNDTIDQAGEYFTFDIRNESQIGFGLVHTQASYDAGYYSGNSTYANPSNFGTFNSAHGGYQFSHWFHPTPNGSWTNYGANTSYSQGEAWYNENTHFEARDEWLNGDPIKIKVGINENGFITISSLADDGVTWKLHARTTYAVVDGSEFRLGVKMGDTNARLYSLPKVHLLEPAAPTMYFRYIESPDGNFEYPLFATEEEANYYDSENGGSGTSHTHTYSDDPTNTTWYMPDTGGVENGTSAPTFDLTLGQSATYTEITSLTNADQTPPLFAQSNITQEEGTSVNIQINPAGSTWATSVSISPSGSGLIWDGYSMVQGTLADVGADTTYTITVTRGNSYGSTTGQMTVTATDVAPVTTMLTPWNKAIDFSGSSERAQMVSTSSTHNPLMMRGLATTVYPHSSVGSFSNDVGLTSDASSAAPWATAIVFKYDGNNSNQHIWNAGEGVNGDNIYLRISANGYLYFGWGRDGSGINECSLGGSLDTNKWFGVYIAHTGARFSSGQATAANLAAAFDIYLMRDNGSGVWTRRIGTLTDADGNRSLASNWTSNGYRMDRSTLGALTIGGRGSNRSFNGKVASMVVTTLRRDVAMPTLTEIETMVTDPVRWLNDYKVGQAYRVPSGSSDYASNFSLNQSPSRWATQVWIMGDGSNDSYSNMIRNQVSTGDQNQSKLNLISMVSNDIQNVNISGLT